MSWHFSQALVSAWSEAGCLTTKSSVQWSKTRSASKSLWLDRKTRASRRSLSGTTQEPSRAKIGVALSMSSVLDSHANPMPCAASKKAFTMNGIFGQIPPESLAKYDHDSSSWRTYLPLFNTWEPYSPETWPEWATLLGTELFQQRKPTHLISEKGGGAWPTPTANTRPNAGHVRLLRKQVLEGKLSEEEATQMLNGKSPFSAQGAVTAYEKKWPTPTSRDYKDGVYCPNVPTNKLLGREVWEGDGNKGRLNPDWVEWLMGVPIKWTCLKPLDSSDIMSWEKDPGKTGEIPRLTEDKWYRTERLKALGNGQVPQQLALAWKVLTK